MSGFFEGGIKPLVSSVLLRENPLYVQYYVTARCNLRCVQCNVIYSNADQQECTTAQAGAIAENLASIGTSIVLLTGGEPFIRKDLVEIASNFVKNGVHPRLQTNGLASAADLDRMAAIGAHDISISLDSLTPSLQNDINGGFDKSWDVALEKVSHINSTFPNNSFCSFGCVLSPTNLDEIVPLIHFATAVGWWVSLVPAHQSDPHRPRSFSTFDPSLLFDPSDYPRVKAVLEEVRALKRQGFNLYDSDEYLDDIYRYVTKSAIRWRRRNDETCDSPNLYFAIQPNGEMAVCCDYRLGTSYPTYDPSFPNWYREKKMFTEAREVASACSGCMYGSYPEITISARYFKPMIERSALFLRGGPKRQLVAYSPKDLADLALSIRSSFPATALVS
jgi:MoaA/NifB/PqqE/SkfB family radical SAM enzyme